MLVGVGSYDKIDVRDTSLLGKMLCFTTASNLSSDDHSAKNKRITVTVVTLAVPPDNKPLSDFRRTEASVHFSAVDTDLQSFRPSEGTSSHVKTLDAAAFATLPAPKLEPYGIEVIMSNTIAAFFVCDASTLGITNT